MGHHTTIHFIVGDQLVDELISSGHEVEMSDAFSDLAGHAGALVRHPSDYCEGASDPRADGGAVTL